MVDTFIVSPKNTVSTNPSSYIMFLTGYNASLYSHFSRNLKVVILLFILQECLPKCPKLCDRKNFILTESMGEKGL